MASKAEIWNHVEKLRAAHPVLGADRLPLDLISFIELDLGLNLIPFDGLAQFGADAALLSDFSGFYVDGETYSLIDNAPEWRLNRLRFSLAHELGHWCLHKEIFQQASIESDQHYLGWLNHHNGQKYSLEKDANEFAGRLLIPLSELETAFDRIAAAFDQAMGRHAWIQDDNFRQKACEQIAPRFGVHHKAIATRFHREDIWPSIF